MPCTKLLPCKHSCIGLCGEICPKKCRECHKDEVTNIYFGTEDEPDARFVELADCGHVFEVEMMDQWMDQAEATDDGKPINVQLKCCPKCNKPIRTSLRYGNIIKKIRADFEQIKRKTLMDEGESYEERARLTLRVQEIDQFVEDKNNINRLLRVSYLTSDQACMIDNQISFLSFLQIIKATAADELLKEMREDLERKVEQLQKLVMKFRIRFSDQELEELNDEMYRTQLLVDFRLLEMQLDIGNVKLGIMDTLEVNFVTEALDSGKTIGKSTVK